MKRFVLLFISLMLISTATACSKQEPKSTDTTDQTAESETVNPESAFGKTLVVYYSASGNTKAVADTIAAVTKADCLALVPKQPYSDADLNWRDAESRVVYEYEHPEARNVELEETTVSDWDSYDTVFIGYPIWWGIAAWPVDGFIKANDFTGKTIIPFCTSSSSDLGESGTLLAKAANSGNWQTGMRFASSASQDGVMNWLKELAQQKQDE